MIDFRDGTASRDNIVLATAESERIERELLEGRTKPQPMLIGSHKVNILEVTEQGEFLHDLGKMRDEVVDLILSGVKDVDIFLPYSTALVVANSINDDESYVIEVFWGRVFQVAVVNQVRKKCNVETEAEVVSSYESNKYFPDIKCHIKVKDNSNTFN